MMLGWPNPMYHILTMGHSDLRLKVFSTGPSRAISCNVTSCPISKVWFRGTFAHTQHHVFPDTRDIYTKKWKIMCIYKYQCKYINIYIYLEKKLGMVDSDLDSHIYSTVTPFWADQVAAGILLERCYVKLSDGNWLPGPLVMLIRHQQRTWCVTMCTPNRRANAHIFKMALKLSSEVGVVWPTNWHKCYGDGKDMGGW
jgi:hypothetical protein